MNITLGFSPCPNDCFIFDAMVHGKIDTEGLTFEPVMEDVEALNRRALAGGLDVTKLSYHAFAHLTYKYALLDAGSALGHGCGPLLVGREVLSKEEIERAVIAIPGRLTTANFLLSLAFPSVFEKREMLFSEIEDAVVDGRVHAGLIIHENRFTFEKKGLKKIIDLGEFWERETGLPIPLGGIVARRGLPENLSEKINRVLRRSVEYAFSNPESPMPFIRDHAQAMSDEVMRAHISLYVNEFSVSLGEKGRASVRSMFELARARDIIQNFNSEIFSNRLF